MTLVRGLPAGGPNDEAPIWITAPWPPEYSEATNEYVGALSIEHEDSPTSSREGLEQGADLLQPAVFETTPGDAYWTRPLGATIALDLQGRDRHDVISKDATPTRQFPRT